MSADTSLHPAAAALLALADQRLPSGGHVHSGGVEQAVAEGRFSDEKGLALFLERRLRTVGLVAAGIAAGAVRVALDDAAPPASTGAASDAPAGTGAAAVRRLDAEADARTPSPAQRAASRAQGRGLLRLASAAWAAPSPTLAWRDLGPRPHHPIVLGCAVAAVGARPLDAALVTAYLAVSGPATAAQRLLALDPVAVATVTLDLGAAVEDVARLAAGPPSDPWGLPDESDPLMDLLAERHAAREERLFAS